MIFLNKNSIHLILLFAISLIDNVLSIRKPFYCDTNYKKTQLENLNVGRFLMFGNTVYILLHNKRYSFSIPYYYRYQVDFKDHDHFFIKKQIYEDDHSESKSYKTDDLYGFIQIPDEQLFEIRLNRKSEFFELHLIDHKSDFKREINRNMSFQNKYEQYLENYLSKPYADFELASAIINKNNRFFSLQSNSSSIELVYVEQIGEKQTKKLFPFKHQESIQFASSYIFDPDYDNRINKRLAIIELQPKTKIIKISQFNEKNIQQKGDYKIDLSDFFGCLSEVKDINEIKGIFYQQERLFLIVNTNYIPIIDPNRLLKNKFKLEKQDYSNMKPLKNFDSNIKQIIPWEMNVTRWLKSVGNQNFLTFSDLVFSIDFRSGELYFNRTTNEDELILAGCNRSILFIHKIAYCFTKYEYYRLGKFNSIKSSNNLDDDTNQNQTLNDNKNKRELTKVYRIKDIFRLTDTEYDDSEKMEIIFNYSRTNNSLIIMMTKSFIYLFTPNAFYEFDEYDNKNSRLTIKKDAILFKVDNCLPKCRKFELHINRIDLFKYIIIILLILSSIMIGISCARFSKTKDYVKEQTKKSLDTLNKLKSKSFDKIIGKKSNETSEKKISKSDSKLTSTGSKLERSASKKSKIDNSKINKSLHKLSLK